MYGIVNYCYQRFNNPNKMKKIVLSAMVLCLFQTQALMAQDTDISGIENVIYIAPQTADAGSQYTLSVSMKNSVPIRGFQFNLYLPEGVTVAKNTSGKIRTSLTAARLPEDDEHTVTAAEQPDGSILFLCGSQYDETFTGTDGEILTVIVEVASGMEEGDYVIALRNIELTETDISQYYDVEEVLSTLTVASSDGRIHFDENSMTQPAYTAGEKGDVTMKRTIKKGVWSTLVLPFNLTRSMATSLFGSDVEFAQYSGFEVDYGDDEENITPLGITIKFSSYSIPARGNLAGGTPVLIRVNAPQEITTIEADNVTLTSGVNDVNIGDEYGTAGKFTGTLVKTKVPADGLFLSDNNFWYSTGKTNIKAFRGWFELDAVLGKETEFGAKVRFVIDDVPTAIEDMNIDLADGAVYTVQGLLVGKNVEWETLPGGIYIVNGRKVLKR